MNGMVTITNAPIQNAPKTNIHIRAIHYGEGTNFALIVE